MREGLQASPAPGTVFEKQMEALGEVVETAVVPLLDRSRAKKRERVAGGRGMAVAHADSSEREFVVLALPDD